MKNNGMKKGIKERTKVLHCVDVGRWRRVRRGRRRIRGGGRRRRRKRRRGVVVVQNFIHNENTSTRSEKKFILTKYKRYLK